MFNIKKCILTKNDLTLITIRDVHLTLLPPNLWVKKGNNWIWIWYVIHNQYYQTWKQISSGMSDVQWTPLIQPPLWSRVLGGCFAVLLIVLNSIEITILRQRKKKKAYEKLLLSLSVADLLLGVLAMTSGSVGAFAHKINAPYVDTYTFSMWIIVILFGVLASMLHLISISVMSTAY